MQALTMSASGRLDEHSPLHAYLATVVLPRLGIEVLNPDSQAFRLSNRQAVYLSKVRHDLLEMW